MRRLPPGISGVTSNIITYYDYLADAGDPVGDPEPLVSYMNKWDG
jgi:hypothetical protein